MDDVDPEDRGQDLGEVPDQLLQDGDEGIAARATVTSSPADRIERCPHAALALAMASTAGATWGSSSHVLSISGDSTTEFPEDEDQLIDECSSELTDFDEYIIGPEQIPDQADAQSASAAPAEEEPPADEWELIGEEAEPVRRHTTSS